MSDINQVINKISEAFENMHKNPSIYGKKILSYLFDLRVKEEYQYLSDSEFFDIVGKTFKLNPKYFMKFLFTKIGQKMSKIYGDEKRREMEKYILEKFCLYSGEQIIYEFDGYIHQARFDCYKFAVRSGSIFVTNHRIIAQGKLKTYISHVVKSGREAMYDRKAVVGFSEQQKLPCCGFIFPIKDLSDLEIRRDSQNRDSLFYIGEWNKSFKIIPSASNREERRVKLDKIVEILNKIKIHERVDVPQLKTEVLQPVPSITDEKKEKPVKNCPHCGQELFLEAKFCIKCGKKVEELQPIPSITDEKKEKPVIVVPLLKTEEVQPILSISDKKKEKHKEVSYICKFCGYKLNKKAIFCPQCGTKIKRTNFSIEN